MQSDEEETGDTYFTIMLEAWIKDFANQQNRNVSSHGIHQIQCKNSEEFKEKLWELFQDTLQKEVKFNDDNTAEICPEVPTIHDINKFIRIKKSNHFHLPGNISITSLQNFSNSTNPVAVFVCRYSFNVVTKAHWTVVQAQFVAPRSTDRSGAASNSILFEIVRLLKQEWGERYEGSSANWITWASYIADFPTHAQEENIKEPPPPAIIGLFRPVPNNREQRIDSLHSSSRVTMNILEHAREELRKMKEIHRLNVEECKIRHTQMSNILSAFENTLNAYDRVIPELESASRPTEGPLTHMFQNRITEQTDIDHAI
ncbi:hypothetical protein HDV04_001474 [Boothiomyces sp. JEL0838]|nr:hypothetical protein HDV04_004627 [Boothiomyces sp. JEL0838]KAJ3313913.1 hypothetical protein HDV04_001474 [Boothiomyces sp. JEL0838]